MTTEKSTSKKTVKKTVKKKPEKLDLATFTVSATELGYILGIATSNITVAVQNGAMTPDADGRFNLRDTVSAYCRRWREKKAGDGRSKSDIDTETAIWKLSNLKIKNRDWRMQRDRMLVTEILKALAESIGELRELAKMNPALCEEIDAVLGRIGRIDVDSISLSVEGEEEDEDEI